MRKITIFIMFTILLLTLGGCNFTSTDNNSGITILNSDGSFNLGDVFTMSRSIDGKRVYYISSDNSVIYIDGYIGRAISYGEVIISAYSENNIIIEKYLVSVASRNPEEIEIEGDTKMYVGEDQYLTVIVSPDNSLENINFHSSDEAVATVNANGLVTALSSGLVNVSTSSIYDASVNDSITIIVEEIVTGSVVENTEIINTTEQIDLSLMQSVFKPLIDSAKQSIIGVSSYDLVNNKTTLIYSATGVIYKRTCILGNGEEGSDKDENFKYYKYYVITNKHIVENRGKVIVYNQNEKIDAEVIAYDTKVDIAVISFIDTKYYQTAVFGSSDNCMAGEFVLSIGNPYGVEGFQSVSLGVISSNQRYVSTDTDGDGTNDWDALYIQHDAAISEGNSGGVIINLKGEVIGINSVKLSDEKIDNMSFSIPSNIVIDLVSQLEKGIIPVRPLLGVEVMGVKDILNSETLQGMYPLAPNVTYGFYVASVDSDGVGSQAGIIVGDVIVEFNGVSIYYSYQLRAAINECIIGSNEEIEIKVNRNGEIVILKAVF